MINLQINYELQAGAIATKFSILIKHACNLFLNIPKSSKVLVWFGFFV